MPAKHTGYPLPIVTCLLLLVSSANLSMLQGEERVDFSRQVAPILSDHCFACHGPDADKRAAELRLDQPEGAYASRDGEAAIVPGNLQTSLLWMRINSSDENEVMPPPEYHKELTELQKSVLRQWIEQGAEYKQHWAFNSPVQAAVPRTKFTHPVDAFLEREREKQHLTHNPRADRRTLIRRITLDLTGLPPTLDEVRRFVNDPATDSAAYSTLVDDLLERSSYGEHMARAWLDLARYADTHGLHLDNKRSMWPYRDWVVRAFNQNLPFDEFTRWQLAGDLLPEATRDQQIASGFNRCNVTTSEGGSIDEEWIYRYAVDRTTTTAEVWMGLTAGCAVCHDHKFDPLSTKEYYSLYAFFHSAADPAMDRNIIDTPPVLRLYSPEEEQEIAQIKSDLDLTDRQLKAAIAELEYIDPATLDPVPPAEVVETVWFEDNFPPGTEPKNAGGPLQLIGNSNGSVFSGQNAIERTASGLAQDFFHGGAEFIVPAGGTFFVHCYLDPENPPETIMIQFHTDGWKHRAVWGVEEKIPFGKPETPEKVLMGPLPATGEWVRLEVPAGKLGLKAGNKVAGYAFTQFAGTVRWDRLGVKSTLNKAKEASWSYRIWQEKNQGKRNNALPDGLQQLVRGKKSAEWTAEESQAVYEFWLENFYSGADANPEISSLKQRKTSLTSRREEMQKNVASTLIMADLPEKRKSYVMVRGAYDKPGEEVQCNVPGFLPPLPELKEERNYNRLDLANWLVDGNHPLTARVTVNRFWQQFFGTGLVKTSADFGLQGEPPSHPELLDWLAVEFVQQGWDVKHIVKLIVTSEAYCQSTVVSDAVMEKDPENRYLARGPRLRLDAEVLRDQALFVSGLLVDQPGGPGVHPYQPDNIWEPVAYGGSNTRFYTQGTGEDLYRRSLYTFLKRTAPPPFMTTFDAPSREQSCSSRERTNTPLQALQLMNDVQYFEAARAFAERMLTEGGDTPQQQTAWGWEVVTSRVPTPEENQIVLAALQEFQKRYQASPEEAQQAITFGASSPSSKVDPAELAAFTLIANLLLNLDEAINKN